MKLDITLNEKSIENIIEYIKTHPKEIKGLVQYLGDEVFDVVMSRKVLKKGAQLYRAINSEINFRYEIEEEKYDKNKRKGRKY